MVWATIVAISPWQSSRYLMAKNEHVCLRSGFVAMRAVLFLYVFLALGGVAINLFDPEISPSEIAFIWAARNVLPVGLGVVIVTGIVAAGLSLPIWAHPVIPGSAAGLAGILLGNLGRRPDAQGLEFRKSLMAVSAADLEPGRLAVTLRFAAATAAVCLLVIAVLALVYYMPFAAMPVAG